MRHMTQVNPHGKTDSQTSKEQRKEREKNKRTNLVLSFSATACLPLVLSRTKQKITQRHFFSGVQFWFWCASTCDLYFIHILWPKHDEITVHNGNSVTQLKSTKKAAKERKHQRTLQEWESASSMWVKRTRMVKKKLTIVKYKKWTESKRCVKPEVIINL